MPYVQRDEGGAIIGVFANPQEWLEPEFLEEEDAEVTAFSPDLSVPVAEDVIVPETTRLAALEQRMKAVEAALSIKGVIA